MPEYDDELSGVLFPQRDKKSDRSPDFTGRCTIDGIEYRMAGWKRASKSSGTPFISLKFNIEEEREEVDPEGALEL
jgi:uncharacterized protein (DUF736 family)